MLARKPVWRCDLSGVCLPLSGDWPAGDGGRRVNRRHGPTAADMFHRQRACRWSGHWSVVSLASSLRGGGGGGGGVLPPVNSTADFAPPVLSPLII